MTWENVTDKHVIPVLTNTVVESTGLNVAISSRPDMTGREKKLPNSFGVSKWEPS